MSTTQSYRYRITDHFSTCEDPHVYRIQHLDEASRVSTTTGI